MAQTIHVFSGPASERAARSVHAAVARARVTRNAPEQVLKRNAMADADGIDWFVALVRERAGAA